jgi:hypothetical protein
VASVPVSAQFGSGLVSQPDPAARARAIESYGRLPLSFEANAGQAGQRVKFLSRGSRYTLFLTSNEAVLALRKAVDSKPNSVQNQLGRRKESQARKTDPALPPRVPTPNSESPASAILRMKLVGANAAAGISGLEQLPGTSNYFIGNDPNKWRTAVPNYAKVRYQGVYPGVDLVYYGNQRQLEYDFVVAPGADPRSIKLDFTGMVGDPAKGAHRTSLRIDDNGDLIVRLNDTEVSFQKPIAYQLVSDSSKATSESIARDIVEARYVLQSNGQVSIGLATYDATRTLTIDPIVLSYSSYLGGSEYDQGTAIAVDSSGNTYITGVTNSNDFPTMGQISGGCVGNCPGTGANSSVFVTKINAKASALVYSSYIGGTGEFQSGQGIAVDSSGNAYVTGYTNAPDFPVVGQIPGACLGTCGTGKGPYGTNGAAFVTKINAAGSALVYCSLIGGSEDSWGYGIAVDSSDNAYITGPTDATDFPRVHQISGACNGTCGSGGGHGFFVTEVNAAGNALVYCSLIGGSGGGGNGDSGLAIAVDSSGNAYLTGYTTSGSSPSGGNFPTVGQIPGACLGSCGTPGNFDVFVTKVNATGSALGYSSLIGGSNAEQGNGIAVDSSGNAYLTGSTASGYSPSGGNFPTASQIPVACLGGCGTLGNYDAFVTKINATGSALVYSSLFGGSSGDSGAAIAVDHGAAFVTGSTNSSNFPRAGQIAGACNPTCGTGANSDAFVVEIDIKGTDFSYSSYLGGSENENGTGVAVDLYGNAYVTGYTSSVDFPLLDQGIPGQGIPGACLGNCGIGAYTDAFVTKIVYVLGSTQYYGAGCPGPNCAQ